MISAFRSGNRQIWDCAARRPAWRLVAPVAQSAIAFGGMLSGRRRCHSAEWKRIDQNDPRGLTTRYSGRAREVVRYDSVATRLVEVTIPSGASAPPVNAVPGVLAFDTAAAFGAVDAALDKKPGRSPPPAGMAAPRCITLGANQMAAIINKSGGTLHFYRIEFKRIDGAGLREHWRVWYPFMLEMQ